MQRRAADRIDVNVIALHAIARRAVAFVGRDADAGFLQALRQGEAAETATDDDDVEPDGLHIEE